MGKIFIICIRCGKHKPIPVGGTVTGGRYCSEACAELSRREARSQARKVAIVCRGCGAKAVVARQARFHSAECRRAYYRRIRPCGVTTKATKACERCGRRVLMRHNGRFCSSVCRKTTLDALRAERQIAHPPKREIVCVHCGSIVVKKAGARFCSKECRVTHYNRRMIAGLVMLDRFMTVSEFSKATGRSRSSIYHQIFRSKMPAERVLGRVLIPKDLLERL